MDMVYLLDVMDAHATLQDDTLLHAQNDHMDVLNSMSECKGWLLCAN